MKSNSVRLDSSELKDFLNHMIENNRVIQAEGKNPVAVEILGESGLGKTSSVIQLADERKLNFVKLNLAQIEELGDLVGFPIRQFKMIKEAESGLKVQQWIDEHAVEEFSRQGYKFTGQKRMSYCPPEWIADKTGGGILLLDDWNRADIRFIQAVMELVDRQEYISWKLPKDWHILLTANPDNGSYMVNTIDVAQRTRFVSVEYKFDVDRWAEWAEANHIDSRCINFMLMHPEIINEQVNPRSITTFFNAISSIPVFEDKLGLIQQIGEGSVGIEVASLFTQFIANKLDKLITPKKMLLEGTTGAVINELRSIMYDGSGYRADIASLMTSRLTNYGLFYAEKNSIDQKIIDRIVAFIEEEDLFNYDLKYIIARKLVTGNKAKFQKLVLAPTVNDLITK
jgi:hypothetical protein